MQLRTLTYFLLITMTAVGIGCVKTSDSSDDDLVGNWMRRWDFEAKARTEAVSAVTADGKVFVGLGFDGINRLTDFWEYNHSNEVWYQRQSFPGAPRNSAICFSALNKIYVGLGYDGVNYLNDMWRYDPQTDAWEPVAAFPSTGRSGAVAFSINDKGYVSSGYDGNHLKDFWEYDAAGDVWTKKNTHIGLKRNDAVAFVIDNKAYFCTGVNNGEYVNDFFMYDPSTDTWEAKRPIANTDSDLDYDDDYTTITRSNAVAFSLNGKGYITTGINISYRSNTWEYDPATDLWAQRTGFEGTDREGAVAFVINNRAFVGLGNSSNLRFDNFWEFIPGVKQVDND
ncbi:MAG: hypothetical protein JNL51_14855 [Chitinophagaceae bacterium]|nr:hypothetical protein [Chitinophagaceae bacterium]